MYNYVQHKAYNKKKNSKMRCNNNCSIFSKYNNQVNLVKAKLLEHIIDNDFVQAKGLDYPCKYV